MGVAKPIADLLADAAGGFVDIPVGDSAVEFLDRLVREHGAVLHGSADANIRMLEPRQPKAKAGPNSTPGVWAATDATMVVFWATLNRVSSMQYIDVESETGRYVATIKDLSQKPDLWRHAVVYILDGRLFRRMGNATCLSDEAVRPLAKVAVGPGDFPDADRVELSTTVDENQAYFNVKEATAGSVPSSAFRTRWTDAAYEIDLIHDEERIVFCRLYVRGRQHRIGIVGEDGETVYDLRSLDEIRRHAAELRVAAKECCARFGEVG